MSTTERFHVWGSGSGQGNAAPIHGAGPLTVTVYRWLAHELSEQGVPAEVVQRFLDGLHGVDAKFPSRIAANGQIQGFKAAEKNAGLANVLPRFSELETLLTQLLGDIDRHAQQAT